MIKFITGFKTKKQLIDVIKILQKKKVTYAFKDDVKLKEKIDRVWAQFKIKDDEKLKLAIHIWDFYVSDDKTRDVFSFVHQTKKHPNTITATKFIEQNLSAPYIVLKELMRAWGEGEGTPRHKFKEMLVGRPKNALSNSILTLKKRGVNIFIDEYDDIFLVAIPEGLYLGKNRIYQMPVNTKKEIVWHEEVQFPSPTQNAPMPPPPITTTKGSWLDIIKGFLLLLLGK